LVEDRILHAQAIYLNGGMLALMLGDNRMPLQLPQAHRLARINYPTRSGTFAFSFLIVVAFLVERGFSAGTLFFGVLTLLIYPQLAYLHARIAVDSKRAEFRNLIFDSVLMGLWVAQLHFALWPFCAALTAVSLGDSCPDCCTLLLPLCSGR